jgi:hypothetical protein
VTQTYAKRILVEDVDVFDGNAAVNVIGSVTGASGWLGYNLYLDDIKIYTDADTSSRQSLAVVHSMEQPWCGELVSK